MPNSTQYESNGGVVMQAAHQPLFDGERPEVAMRPVKLSLEPKLLEVLCLYELQKPVDDVSEDKLRALITQRVQSLKNSQVPELDALFKKHLNVDMHEDDIDARRIQWRMKLRCNVLIDNLGPAVLREEGRRHTRNVDQGARRNYFVLFRVIKEKARAQHAYHVLSKYRKSKFNLDRRDMATNKRGQ
eukprot:jgi/Phyca11/102500/e_gw1.6.635.1